MKMKTSILNAITDINLELISHCSIILFLLLGFYACSKTGVKNAPTKVPPQESSKIKEAGSSVSATTFIQDENDLKNEHEVIQISE
jgi:hypothetical protein